VESGRLGSGVTVFAENQELTSPSTKDLRMDYLYLCDIGMLWARSSFWVLQDHQNEKFGLMPLQIGECLRGTATPTARKNLAACSPSSIIFDNGPQFNAKDYKEEKN
jgi:hypothetical protein